MRKVYTPPELTHSYPLQIALALGITALIFLVLPLTQLFGSLRKELLILRPVEIVIPPPPPPKEPPPEEKKEQQKPELKEKPRPLTLSQLELVLNPGTGGALEGDFGLGFSLAPDTIAEMKIFELHEVDKEPQPIHEPLPNYPIKLYRERVRGSVVLTFVVDENGAVGNVQIKQSSTYREFDQAALSAVSQWKFTPGIKDGQPVRTRFEQEFTFDPTR